MGPPPRFPPLLLLGLLPPDQAWPFFAILHRHLIEIRYLRMGSLDAPQAQKHFVAVFQFAFRDALFKSRQCLFDLSHKATPDGLLFLLPSDRAAQDIGLFASRNLDLLDLHFRSDLFEIILEQFLFKLLQFAARGAHQILSAALADGHQVLFTYHAAVEDPHPASLSVLAFHRA